MNERSAGRAEAFRQIAAIPAAALRRGVDKPGQTEAETQRTDANREWNRGRVGGPNRRGIERREILHG